MIEQVEVALQRRDYRTASNLLEKMADKQPDSALVKLYTAKLQEAHQRFDLAEPIYRHLLQTALEPKVLQEARQGIARLQEEAQVEKIEVSRAATLFDVVKAQSYQPSHESLLILKTIDAETKNLVAPQFAQVMKLDLYTAKSHLPGRSWRLYRVGSHSEINFYAEQFELAQVPYFAGAIDSLNQPHIIMVRSIDQFTPKLVFTTTDNYGSESVQRCTLSHIKTMVFGLLPIFEEITEKSQTIKELKVRHRSKVLDYVQVCDLHLPAQNTILRLCSQHYNFQKDLDAKHFHTSRESWQRMIDRVQEQVPNAQIWKEFTPFAETALEYPEVLEKIPAHLNLIRRKPSLWDQAFQIYSTAIFLHSKIGKQVAILN
jgi:hypothetical protein